MDESNLTYLVSYLKKEKNPDSTWRIRFTNFLQKNTIECTYINNLNELLKRLYFIAAVEGAENNYFHNGKLGVLRFVSEEMEKCIDTSQGTEYFFYL